MENDPAQFRLSDFNQKSHQSLSVCMIVKNEEKYLLKCMNSVRSIANEIIIVDTGSTDRTRDIALTFGATVYDYEWVDDFSAARNFGLSKAHGDLIFVLDADEMLSTREHDNFRTVLGASQGLKISYRIQTRNYSNLVNTVGFKPNRGEFPEEEGIGWYPSDKVRLFTNDPRIRFEYPVHEMVEPSLQRLNIPIRECPIAVHHYGSLDDGKIYEKTKIYHNLGITKQKKYINNSVALKELAVQLSQLGNHAEAFKIWRRYVKIKPRSAEAYLNMGAACWNLARYSEAVTFSEKALRIDPTLKEAAFNMAFSMVQMGRARDAETTLERLLERQPDYLAAQFLLCVVYVCLQKLAHAEDMYKKLKSSPVGSFVGESFLEVSKRFLAASRCDYLHRISEAAIRFGCAGPEMITLFENCKAVA
jgi:glycosyltransferase involved in cell wall biosynthesis